MHVALHNVRTRLSLRALVLFGATVTLIIVGLLALHTFTAESATHTVVGATSPVPDTNPIVVTTGSDEAQIACDAPCESSAAKWPAHDDLLMACVLAVLAGFLLLALPRPVLRRIPVVHDLHPRSRDFGTPHMPEAPSLVVLSISRT
ncbi:hypothetical protein ACQ143_08570 [Microbacterium sp. MC2]